MERVLKKVLKGLTFDFRIPAYTLYIQNRGFLWVFNLWRWLHVDLQWPLSLLFLSARWSSPGRSAGPEAPSSPAGVRVSCSPLRTRPWSCPPRSRWTWPPTPRPRPPSPSASPRGSTWVRWSSRPTPWWLNAPTIYVWTYDPPRLFRRVYLVTLYNLFPFFCWYFLKQKKHMDARDKYNPNTHTPYTVTAGSVCVGLQRHHHVSTSSSHAMTWTRRTGNSWGNKSKAIINQSMQAISS